MADSLGIPRFANGTDYVPRTGLALIHQGEKIIPAAQNNGGGVTVNVYEAPGTKATVSQQSNGNGGFGIKVLIEQIEGALGQNISKGGGLAPMIEGRYGLSSAAGAVR